MANNAHPIKPSEVVAKKEKSFPDAVFEAFNELITKKWDGSSATVRQDEVVDLMVKKGLEREEIFDNGWLNVEDIYRSAGWVVRYDKPGYDEDYSAYFTFESKEKRN